MLAGRGWSAAVLGGMIVFGFALLPDCAHAQSSQARAFISDVRSFDDKIKKEAIAAAQRIFSDGVVAKDIRRWLEEDSPWHPFLKQPFHEGLSHAHRVAHARLIGDVKCREAAGYERRGFYKLYPELRNALSDKLVWKIFRQYILPIHSYRHRLCLAMRLLAPAVAKARRYGTNVFFYHFSFESEDWYEKKREAHLRLSLAIAVVDQSAICKGMKSAMAYLLRNQRELSYDSYHPEALEWIKYWLGKSASGDAGTLPKSSRPSPQVGKERQKAWDEARRKSCSMRLEYFYKYIQPDE